MGSSTVTLPATNITAEAGAEPMETPDHPLRGTITGIVLGAGLWSVILVSFRLIKL